MDDSGIICDEVIDADNKINFIEKKATCKTQNFYILLVFLLITIALLINVTINRYLVLIKTFITLHYTNNKLNKFYIDSINRK